MENCEKFDFVDSIKPHFETGSEDINWLRKSNTFSSVQFSSVQFSSHDFKIPLHKITF